MITTLKHGITVHDAAEGAIVQTVEVTAKKEKSTVLGMKGTPAKTQVVKVFEHTEVNEFSVTGKGDLTLVPGIGADADISLLTGGVLAVWEFSYTQKIAEPSEWSYSGEHYPHAA